MPAPKATSSSPRRDDRDLRALLRMILSSRTIFSFHFFGLPGAFGAILHEIKEIDDPDSPAVSERANCSDDNSKRGTLDHFRCVATGFKVDLNPLTAQRSDPLRVHNMASTC